MEPRHGATYDRIVARCPDEDGPTLVPPVLWMPKFWMEGLDTAARQGQASWWLLIVGRGRADREPPGTWTAIVRVSWPV